MGLKVRLQEKKVPLTSLKLDGIGSTEGNASSDGSSDDPTTTTTEENTSDHGSGDDTTTTTTTEGDASDDGSGDDQTTTTTTEGNASSDDGSGVDPTKTLGKASDLRVVASSSRGKLKSRTGKNSTVKGWECPSQNVHFVDTFILDNDACGHLMIFTL